MNENEFLKRLAGEHRKASGKHAILNQEEVALVQRVIEVAAETPIAPKGDEKKTHAANPFLYPH